MGKKMRKRKIETKGKRGGCMSSASLWLLSWGYTKQLLAGTFKEADYRQSQTAEQTDRPGPRYYSTFCWSSHHHVLHHNYQSAAPKTLHPQLLNRAPQWPAVDKTCPHHVGVWCTKWEAFQCSLGQSLSPPTCCFSSSFSPFVVPGSQKTVK